MAESSLSLTYDDLRLEIALFLGWDRTSANFTTANNTDFQRILDAGLSAFYFPPLDEEHPVYEWSFLRTIGTITLTASNAAYDLADNCSGVVLDDSVSHSSASARRTLSKVPESVIRKQQAMASKTGAPEQYAVRAKAHTPTTGQRYEMLVYPTPTSTEATQIISFAYVWIPETLTTGANIYPAGGGRYSECVRLAVLAAAESIIDDDPVGVYNQRFTNELKSAIRADLQYKANDRGGRA